MNNKQFSAILAKNEIVREIADAQRAKNGLMGDIIVSSGRLLYQLLEIEKYIGTGNQPSIEDILED
jgi:hypothetical protein